MMGIFQTNSEYALFFAYNSHSFFYDRKMAFCDGYLVGAMAISVICESGVYMTDANIRCR